MHKLVDLAGVDTIAEGVEKGMRALMGDGSSGDPADGSTGLIDASYQMRNGHIAAAISRHGASPVGSGYQRPNYAHGNLAKNQQIAYKAARADGWDDSAARAIVAMTSGESLGGPTNVHWDGSHYAHGIASWDDARSAAIKRKFGHMPNHLSVAQQVKALGNEVRTNPRFAKTLHSWMNPHASAYSKLSAGVHNFEAPKYPDQDTVNRSGFLKGFKPLPSAAKLAGQIHTHATDPKGKARLDIHHHNPPKGLRTKADGGNLFKITHVQHGAIMAPSTEI